MTTANLAQAVPWGDRTELLPKRMSYVASLDVTVKTFGHYLQVQAAANEDDPPGFRHLFGDDIVTMPEGLRCDLPAAWVVGGDGEIGTASDPASASLRLHVSARIANELVLDIEGLGVVNIDGGSARLWNKETISGKAFVATRNEVVSPAYRWLYRRQLFGAGTVDGKRAPSGEWLLTFSFDFYAAA